jgi:hypothetical protein
MTPAPDAGRFFPRCPYTANGLRCVHDANHAGEHLVAPIRKKRAIHVEYRRRQA